MTENDRFIWPPSAVLLTWRFWRKPLGWLMLLTPFVFMAVVEVEKGWLFALGAFLFLVAVVGLILGGARLIGK